MNTEGCTTHHARYNLWNELGRGRTLNTLRIYQKNHPGGLKGRKIKPKVVRHHANVDYPECCFVRLFKRYRELCPADTPPHAFYLQPAIHPGSITVHLAITNLGRPSLDCAPLLEFKATRQTTAFVQHQPAVSIKQVLTNN